MNGNYSFLKSFHFAIQGIAHAVKENRNIRIHLIILVLVLILSYVLRLARDEFLGVLVMIILVISAEMINTSIEEMTNLITSEHRQEAKIAKDVSAGMVLVVAIGAAVVGIYIFLPHLLSL